MIVLIVLADEAVAASPSQIVVVLAAVTALVTALGASILLPILRHLRVIHTVVNQRLTDANRYNVALVEELKRNGIPIPVDQSLPVTGQGDAQPGQPTT